MTQSIQKGDSVLYYEEPDSPPQPAIVANVVNERVVTLSCLYEDGTWRPHAAVNVVVAGEPLPTQRYCEAKE